MEKLRIGVISIDFERSVKVAESIMRKEDSFEQHVNIVTGKRMLETKTTRYVFIVYDKAKLNGARFDQLIWDAALNNDFTFTEYLLRFSCVPANLQVIDDRDLLI